MGSVDHQDARAPGGTGVRAAVLLSAAVVLGLILLKQFDTGVAFNQNVGTNSGSATVTTTKQPTVSVIPPTTARPPRPAADVKVLAANGTSTSGLAGKTTEFLRQNGYNVLAPSDATRTVDTSLVEFKPDFEAEARAVAQLLQLPASAVRPAESDPPVADTRNADLLVIIGNDLHLPGDTTSTTKK